MSRRNAIYQFTLRQYSQHVEVMLESLIFTLAVLRAPGLTLSLITQLFETVYPEERTTSATIKANVDDVKASWAWPNVALDRDIRNVVRTRIISSLGSKGTYKVHHVVPVVRQKYGWRCDPSGRSLDIGVTYSRYRVTDCFSDRILEGEISDVNLSWAK